MEKNILNQKKVSLEPLPGFKGSSYARGMTKSVDIKEVGGRFPELADDVLSGEEVFLSKDGEAVLQLVPILGSGKNSEQADKVGLNLGCGIQFAPDFTWKQWEESEKEMEKIWRQHGYID